MHGNARLSIHGRKVVVERHLEGESLTRIAAGLGVSRQTVSKWWRRYLEDPDGVWWLDRSSAPRATPHRVDPAVEAQIVSLRRRLRWGPFQIAYRVGVSRSTVHRVLVDHGVNRIGFLDPPRDRAIRYERDTPGELVHLDTKRFPRIPDGGGRFIHGNVGYRTAERIKQNVGYIHVHAAVDDHTRIAYAGVFDDATAVSCAAFLNNTVTYLASYGIRITSVMTDNAKAYLGKTFTATRTDHGIDHITIRPYRPQTNGKVERFFRTLKTEWSHAANYYSEHERHTALDTWLETYNTQRPHTAIGAPPATRVNNVPE